MLIACLYHFRAWSGLYLCFDINTFVFNCNHETKMFALVWCYILSIEESFSFFTAFCLINKSSMLSSINFIILFSDKRKMWGLSCWQDGGRGWGRRDALWKVSVYFWSIVLSLFILLVSFLYDIFICLIQIMCPLCSNFLPLIQCLTREHTVPNKEAFVAEQGCTQCQTREPTVPNKGA